MPELPDIETYLAALAPRVLGHPITALRIRSPFVLRTVEPQASSIPGHTVQTLRRLGKRIVLGLDGDLFLVIHLMIAGRLKWKAPGAALPTRIGLLALDFEHASLFLTEVSKKQRASLHILRGAGALKQLDPGGVDVLAADVRSFGATLTLENHTLKRALTDPRLFSGIGNAYSDEILFAARLSPLALTSRLSEVEIARLHKATRETLTTWTERLKAAARGEFPEKVTAFREGMAVHGRFRKPCPDCGAPIQRIRYAENEVNYCPKCQTGGRVLADRAMSRLLKEDWPRSLEEMEARGMT
ncbi:MAG TPA: DNA-formamidopyrimidine glycosylase family protein [Gemmatimonadales bacterium]|jgi:formamidopyrimidine-DNA glycosylase|nr:DNA-formamidopyrimidine glycosylase family protein [Gemmatimonadales bacterium]